jgi:hypothetical protein
MLVRPAAEDRLNIRRLAMSSLDKMLGCFPHSSTEALLLWLLMVVVISEIELSSIS